MLTVKQVVNVVLHVIIILILIVGLSIFVYYLGSLSREHLFDISYASAFAYALSNFHKHQSRDIQIK